MTGTGPPTLEWVAQLVESGVGNPEVANSSRALVFVSDQPKILSNIPSKFPLWFIVSFIFFYFTIRSW